ncbi:hypothetical protein HDK64DRAFT_271376 [Phyllosticta capitalensis]
MAVVVHSKSGRARPKTGSVLSSLNPPPCLGLHNRQELPLTTHQTPAAPEHSSNSSAAHTLVRSLLCTVPGQLEPRRAQQPAAHRQWHAVPGECLHPHHQPCKRHQDTSPGIPGSQISIYEAREAATVVACKWPPLNALVDAIFRCFFLVSWTPSFPERRAPPGCRLRLAGVQRPCCTAVAAVVISLGLDLRGTRRRASGRTDRDASWTGGLLMPMLFLCHMHSPQL